MHFLFPLYCIAWALSYHSGFSLRPILGKSNLEKTILMHGRRPAWLELEASIKGSWVKCSKPLHWHIILSHHPTAPLSQRPIFPLPHPTIATIPTIPKYMIYGCVSKDLVSEYKFSIVTNHSNLRTYLLNLSFLSLSSSTSLWLNSAAILVTNLSLIQFILQGVARMAFMFLWQKLMHFSIYKKKGLSVVSVSEIYTSVRIENPSFRGHLQLHIFLQKMVIRCTSAGRSDFGKQWTLQLK